MIESTDSTTRRREIKPTLVIYWSFSSITTHVASSDQVPEHNVRHNTNGDGCMYKQLHCTFYGFAVSRSEKGRERIRFLKLSGGPADPDSKSFHCPEFIRI